MSGWSKAQNECEHGRPKAICAECFPNEPSATPPKLDLRPPSEQPLSDRSGPESLSEELEVLAIKLFGRRTANPEPHDSAMAILRDFVRGIQEPLEHERFVARNLAEMATSLVELQAAKLDASQEREKELEAEASRLSARDWQNVANLRTVEILRLREALQDLAQTAATQRDRDKAKRALRQTAAEPPTDPSK